MSSVDDVSFMATSSWPKNSAATTCAHAAPDKGFQSLLYEIRRL